ncbi:MAG: nitroreductase family protein [Synergistaceae bacterium]|jgi:nitroreductase|nr:nitroreductase family protein [Synergistaceae bacterium]
MTSLDNETIRIILGRRSVRVFEARSVEAEKVELLLECAFAAPSAMNIQPCHIVVVDDKDLLKKIGEASAHSRMAAGAPLGLAVCVDVANYEKKHGFTDGTWMEDASCAMENMLLAARAVGLEGVWLQIANRPEREGTIPSLLNLPEGVRALAMALVGYGAKVKPPHAGVDAARVHCNGW